MHVALVALLGTLLSPAIAVALSPCTSASPWSARFMQTAAGIRQANITMSTRTNGTRAIGGSGPGGTVLERSFLVQLPSDYDSGRTQSGHPVVLSFHGANSSDIDQATIDRFGVGNVTVAGKSLIAVYPLGAFGHGKTGDVVERAWQGAPYEPPGVDDIDFTKQILDQLKMNLCVDDKRIFAAGKSNGGGFVNLLACTPSTSTLFSAFAPVSAALYPDTHPLDGCTPGRAGVPIINFHGLSDKIIAFGGRTADKNGNTAYALPNITQYREAWAIRNGCPSTEETSLAHPFVNATEKTWNCSSTSVVEGWTETGLGHSWPTTEGLDTANGDQDLAVSTATFDATPAAIVPFFDQFALP